jgi:hypothetical protein
MNRQEQEFTELSPNSRPIGQASAASLETLSNRANNPEDRLSDDLGIAGAVLA